MTLDVGLALQRDRGEMEAMDLEELTLWAAFLREQRKVAELRWDLRFGMICSAIALFQTGSNRDWPPERFFPALKELRKTVAASSIKDPLQMRDAMKEWCIAAGGKVIEKDKGKTKKEN